MNDAASQPSPPRNAARRLLDMQAALKDPTPCQVCAEWTCADCQRKMITTRNYQTCSRCGCPVGVFKPKYHPRGSVMWEKHS